MSFVLIDVKRGGKSSRFPFMLSPPRNYLGRFLVVVIFKREIGINDFVIVFYDFGICDVAII